MSNLKENPPKEGETRKEQSGKLRERMADLLQDNKDFQKEMAEKHPKYFSHFKQLNQ